MTDRTFLDSMRAHGLLDKPAATPPAPAPARPLAAAGDPGVARYFEKAVTAEAAGVATAPNGTRSDALNRAAFNLGQLVAGAGLDEQAVIDALYAAAVTNGHVHDDGEHAIRATITSGLGSGAQEPRGVPELRPADPLPVTVLDPVDVGDIRERFPRLDWHALWADEEQEEWILEPILPARRLIAIYSAPKVGKSLLMLELAASIACGRTVLGVTPIPRRVLYVDFENDPRSDVRTRLIDMGFGPDDLDNLCYLSFPTIAALDSDRGGQELLATVGEYGCEVVVIDTVSRAVAGEENDNDTWLAFYRRTGLRLKQAGVALVRLDHSGKDETKGQRGGSAKSGDVDAIWKLSRLTEDTYLLKCDDHRMQVPEKRIVLTRHTSPLRHAVDLTGRAGFDAQVIEIVTALDGTDSDNAMSVKSAQDLVRGSLGLQARNGVIEEAVRRRKARVMSLDEEAS